MYLVAAYSLLIHLFEKRAERFLTCSETKLKLLGPLLGMAEICNIFQKEGIYGKSRLLDKSLVKWTWIILRQRNWSILEHEGPFSEDKTSQFLYFLKWLWHVFLMLSIVTSSYSNGAKSPGPSPECFMVVGFGPVLSLCTNISLMLTSLTPFFHDLKIHKQFI